MTEQTRTEPRLSVPGRPAGRGGTLVAAVVGLCLGLLALGPGLLPGYLLSYDMVFVPAPAFNAAVLGTSGNLPRAVPSDAVMAALARIAPADLVQKGVLLAIFVLACAGAARLLSRERLPAQLAAGVLYAWNPFVAERLILGQWALLLGYAGLPWVAAAAVRLAGGWARPEARLAGPETRSAGPEARSAGPGVRLAGPETRSAGPEARLAGPTARLAAVMLPAAIGGFAAMLITGLVAIPVAACQPLARRARVAWLAIVAGLLAVLSLPWLIPALTRHVVTSPAGVAAFASRADTPFGAFGSLLMLGGGWNAQAVPPGYGGPVSVLSLLLSVLGLTGFALLGRRRWAGLAVAALAGLALALLGAFGAGQDLLRSLIGWWPGFAVLRDGQQFVAPLALAEALGLGLLVARVLAAKGAVELRAGVAIALVAVPVLLLPGLAWGAAGRLQPVEYPADWLAARKLINADPAPGRALLLPWGAYRRFGWNHDEAVLDPWPRLLNRDVVWNDGDQVGATVIPPEDPSAIAINAAVLADGQLTSTLRADGYRYVIVDAGFGPRGGRPYLARLPGCRIVLAGPGLLIYQVPG
jgi:hypothetical protein